MCVCAGSIDALARPLALPRGLYQAEHAPHSLKSGPCAKSARSQTPSVPASRAVKGERDGWCGWRTGNGPAEVTHVSAPWKGNTIIKMMDNRSKMIAFGSARMLMGRYLTCYNYTAINAMRSSRHFALSCCSLSLSVRFSFTLCHPFGGQFEAFAVKRQKGLLVKTVGKWGVKGEWGGKQGSIPTRARLFALAGIAVVVGNFLSTLPAHTHTPGDQTHIPFSRAALCLFNLCEYLRINSFTVVARSRPLVHSSVFCKIKGVSVFAAFNRGAAKQNGERQIFVVPLFREVVEGNNWNQLLNTLHRPRVRERERERKREREKNRERESCK